jgi:hypothetical protein
MFDTIPIEVLFLIFNYLSSPRSFLLLNNSLRSKAIKHPFVKMYKHCAKRMWIMCCEDICKSGCVGLLENVKFLYYDYDRLGAIASVEIINLLINRNKTFEIDNLLYPIIENKNFSVIRYIIHREERCAIRIIKVALSYQDIHALNYIISYGVQLYGWSTSYTEMSNITKICQYLIEYLPAVFGNLGLEHAIFRYQIGY